MLHSQKSFWSVIVECPTAVTLSRAKARCRCPGGGGGGDTGWKDWCSVGSTEKMGYGHVVSANGKPSLIFVGGRADEVQNERHFECMSEIHINWSLEVRTLLNLSRHGDRRKEQDSRPNSLLFRGRATHTGNLPGRSFKHVMNFYYFIISALINWYCRGSKSHCCTSY